MLSALPAKYPSPHLTLIARPGDRGVQEERPGHDRSRSEHDGEHANLAKVAWSRKLFAVAFDENTKAATLDPGNGDAQKGLGRKNEAGVWVDDPKATVKKKNEGKDNEKEWVLKDY